MSEIQIDDNDPKAELLEANNKKYKKELAKLDVVVQRLRFENEVLFKRLEKHVKSKSSKDPLRVDLQIENANDVDLNFNTKVNYVTYLEKKYTGEFN